MTNNTIKPSTQIHRFIDLSRFSVEDIRTGISHARCKVRDYPVNYPTDIYYTIDKNGQKQTEVLDLNCDKLWGLSVYKTHSKSRYWYKEYNAKSEQFENILKLSKNDIWRVTTSWDGMPANESTSKFIRYMCVVLEPTEPLPDQWGIHWPNNFSDKDHGYIYPKKPVSIINMQTFTEQCGEGVLDLALGNCNWKYCCTVNKLQGKGEKNDDDSDEEKTHLINALDLMVAEQCSGHSIAYQLYKTMKCSTTHTAVEICNKLTKNEFECIMESVEWYKEAGDLGDKKFEVETLMDKNNDERTAYVNHHGS